MERQRCRALIGSRSPSALLILTRRMIDAAHGASSGKSAVWHEWTAWQTLNTVRILSCSILVLIYDSHWRARQHPRCPALHDTVILLCVRLQPWLNDAGELWGWTERAGSGDGQIRHCQRLLRNRELQDPFNVITRTHEATTMPAPNRNGPMLSFNATQPQTP